MAAPRGSTDTQSHTEFSTSDPGALADAQAATAAGTAAAEQRYGHYEGNVHGQGAAAGDLAEAPSTQQPTVNLGPWASQHQSTTGSSPASAEGGVT